LTMANTNASPAPSRKQLRDFGLLVGVVFPVLLGWLLPALHGHGFRAWTLWIGLPALTLGLVAPRLLARPYQGWMALGHGLGWINSHIILGAVFVLVLQPIAAVMRLSGHDPLRRQIRADLESYRETRNSHTVNLKRIF
jgi:hypothetical protein